ncbi:ABC transporter permease [Streptomyces adelaidensis]|uniref:ABC transporter permease n=1 Tax=Streptomyces adelaidensis TaxID=2796465 RepID=UPI001906C45D|nr:ABC transporter permease [Streptomyces adelaidensis]
MTAATTPGTPATRRGPHLRFRPRLRGAAWAAGRLHRSALLVWGAYVLAMAGWLLWLRFVTMHEIRQEGADCAGRCVDLETAMSYSTNLSMIGTLVSYLCYGVAAWAGAALTGRDLETGTAQLAWTQSITPARWLTAKLAVPAVALVLGTTVLVLLYRWVWAADRAATGDEWYYPDPMVNRGPLLVAYALCALAVGALAGLALRRALPALSVAAGLMTWFHVYLDRHTDELWPTDAYTGTYVEGRPASHFWPLHLMATGTVLAVTALATAAAFWLLRRRTR